MKLVAIAFLIFIVFVFFGFLVQNRSGFRGGSEAIGGRTGGTAYSGAAAELDPGMP